MSPPVSQVGRSTEARCSHTRKVSGASFDDAVKARKQAEAEYFGAFLDEINDNTKY